MSLLRVDRWHSQTPSATDLSTWRLEPPLRRLIVETGDRQVLADIVFGKYADEGHIFVKDHKKSAVGAVTDALVRVFPNSWEDLAQDAP
ncbi:MAG: hypothetical protein AAFV29_16170, partial [Myxococcota bacterium]